MGDEGEEKPCSSGLFYNIKPCVKTAEITLQSSNSLSLYRLLASGS